MNSLKKTFCILLLLLFSSPSFALGKQGHKIICQLAYQHLSQPKQQLISSWLKNIPPQEQKRIKKYNYLSPTSDITFADACTWADAIKKDPSFKTFNAWHYFNVKRSTVKIKPQACKKNCLPQAILFHQQQLVANKPSASSWQKTQALLFVGHWLGDIHQPLHSSFASDLGGNKVKIKVNNTKQKCANLHWFWDTCLIRYKKRTKQQWLTDLSNNWQKTPTHRWHKNNVWQWADESFQLIRQTKFAYCTLDHKQKCLANNTGVVTLTESYQKHYYPVLEQQILHAAKRLHALLEASL